MGRFFPMTARLRCQTGNHRCIRTRLSQLPPLTHSGAEPLGSSPKRRQSRGALCNIFGDIAQNNIIFKFKYFYYFCIQMKTIQYVLY
uniref:Uncharacterized protein n=1 Tax=uncultured bacterium TB306_p TaxID=1552137 RepID=A0A0K0LBI9_9BACT|nr:hypothetical protein [uncultured bacterium TB306_p]